MSRDTAIFVLTVALAIVDATLGFIFRWSDQTVYTVALGMIVALGFVYSFYDELPLGRRGHRQR